MIEIKKDKINKFEALDLDGGVYIVVGRNGIGKTTLLHKIEEYCKEKKIPVYSYDNYTEGNSRAMEEYMWEGNMQAMVNSAFHSEGEQIFNNFGQRLRKIGQWASKNKEAKEKYVLIDAIDSGLDIDGIDQVKEIAKMIVKDDKNIRLLITANNYALVENQICIDAREGTRLTFTDFTDYATYIRRQYAEARKKKSKK